MKKILILGAGAIGSSVASNFAQANIPHRIIDPWPDLVKTLRSSGVRINCEDEIYQSPPLNAIHLHELAGLPFDTFDIVFSFLPKNMNSNHSLIFHLLEDKY